MAEVDMVWGHVVRAAYMLDVWKTSHNSVRNDPVRWIEGVIVGARE